MLLSLFTVNVRMTTLNFIPTCPRESSKLPACFTMWEAWRLFDNLTGTWSIYSARPSYQNSHCYEFISQSRRIIRGLIVQFFRKIWTDSPAGNKTQRVYAARQRFGALGIGEFSWLGQSWGHNLWKKRHKIMGYSAVTSIQKELMHTSQVLYTSKKTGNY
jgi:hypothetical protein